jgi:RND family efflux transporter MFP subunit
MRHSLIWLTAAPLAAVTLMVLEGCARNEAAEVKAPPLPQVSVAGVISRQITEFDEFTGRFEAVERVEIRPRVSGYIASVNFTEGSDVKKGDVLFVIDPRPYQAERDRAQAQLAQARSQLTLAKSERDRATSLLAQHAISQEEFDTRTAGREQAEANVAAAQAALDSAALNLNFTRVTAPITGRISRALVTSGNLVTSGQTLLTTLVSLDPIYVSFDGDEQVYLKYSKLAHLRGPAEGGNPVRVGLADESGYPHQGVMVFLDNALDPATGTIRSRARLDNHEQLFTPGLFARVQLLGNRKHDAVLINDSAVGTDQTVRYVLVVAAGNKVEYRPVELGPVIDGLRVVQSGLKPGETIVVNGLQRVRPGAQIQPQRVAMGGHGHNADAPLLAHNGSAKDGGTNP